jgi:hypothetical protein
VDLPKTVVSECHLLVVLDNTPSILAPHLCEYSHSAVLHPLEGFLGRERLHLRSAKVALTFRAWLMVTVQLAVPVQAPLQPLKVEPVAGAAVKVTTVPAVNEAEHVAPQLMPAGLLATVPVPAPVLLTVSVLPADTPVPVTSREIVSPAAAKLTLTLWGVVFVGVKRTVTVAVAPEVASVKGLPETIVKGAGTEAVPVTLARVLVTVNVWVAELPMLTLPKGTVVVGVAPMGACAAALAMDEHTLALPLVSTAATWTL